MYYIFENSDKGAIGKAFEMTIKESLHRRNATVVSAQGRTDFIWNHKCYDAKQNGTVLRYDATSRYIHGSSRVLFASHVSYDMVPVDDKHIAVAVHLADTDMFVVDRNAFVAFLLDNNMAKENRERGTINIQTLYNYKKGAYHGRKGKIIESWCADHDLGDDIIGYILQGLDD